MSLSQRLSEFNFDLETVRMLTSLGRSSSQVATELSSLGFNEQLVELVLNNERLFNRVMLRMRVYSEQNTSEEQVRNGFSALQSNLVSNFIDYLFGSDVQPVVQESKPVVQKPVSVSKPVVQESVQESHVVESDGHVEESDVEDEQEDTVSRFNTFFEDCVSQTEEATDILKASDAYRAFTNWWNDSEFNDDVPDKKELKTYLTDRLGKSHKSTWTNVCLA